MLQLRRGLQEPDAVENTRRTVFQALITYLKSNPHVSQSTFDRCRDVLRNVYVLMEMSEKLKMKLKEISAKKESPLFMQDLLDSNHHDNGIFSQTLNCMPASNSRQTSRASSHQGSVLLPPAGNHQTTYPQDYQSIYNENSMNPFPGFVHQVNQSYPHLPQNGQSALHQYNQHNVAPVKFLHQNLATSGAHSPLGLLIPSPIIYRPSASSIIPYQPARTSFLYLFSFYSTTSSNSASTSKPSTSTRNSSSAQSSSTSSRTSTSQSSTSSRTSTSKSSTSKWPTS